MLDYSINEIKEITENIKYALENKSEFYWQEDMQYLLDVIDKYVLDNSNIFYGVKIYNPKTKKYMTAGMGWNNTGKVWSKLGYAKTAIYIDYYFMENDRFLKWYDDILNSYFIINTEKDGIKKLPVYEYILDYLSRQHSEKAKEKIELIKKNIDKYK